MKVGIAVYCAHCSRRKVPIGRSAPYELSLCDDGCSGYRKEPFIGSLWPGETEEEFGYPLGPNPNGCIEIGLQKKAPTHD